jgi:hypothetical protein
MPCIDLKAHKPKQRPSRKVRDLCAAFGVSDAIVPMMVAL